jgi:hypothetical protein
VGAKKGINNDNKLFKNQNRLEADFKMEINTLKWMKLAQDRVQWWTLVLAVLNLRVLLPES